MNNAATVIDITPEVEQRAEAEIALFIAAPIKVVDAATMQLADERVKQADARLKMIEEEFGPYREAAHKAHKGWTTLIKRLSEPVERYKAAHISEVKTFQRLERERIEAEQRRLEEEARKRAEEEKLREAEQAEKEGHHEEAAAIIEEPIEVQVPALKPETPKVDARKYRTVWKGRVTAKHLFVCHIADMLRKASELSKQGKGAEAAAYADYVNALDINQSWLNQKARSLEKNFSMPGACAFEE